MVENAEVDPVDLEIEQILSVWKSDKRSKEMVASVERGPKWRCLADYVLIKPLPVKQTPAGLHLPETAEESADVFRGRIVSIGPGAHTLTGQFVETQLQVGEVVALAFRSPVGRLYIEGEQYILVREGEICAVVEE